jgi:hypothetical protein
VIISRINPWSYYYNKNKMKSIELPNLKLKSCHTLRLASYIRAKLC